MTWSDTILLGLEFAGLGSLALLLSAMCFYGFKWAEFHYMLLVEDIRKHNECRQEVAAPYREIDPKLTTSVVTFVTTAEEKAPAQPPLTHFDSSDLPKMDLPVLSGHTVLESQPPMVKKRPNKTRKLNTKHSKVKITPHLDAKIVDERMSQNVTVIAAQCPNCLDLVYSRTKEDTECCYCGATSVTGGYKHPTVEFDYTRVDKPKEYTIVVNASEKDLEYDYEHGIGKLGRLSLKQQKQQKVSLDASAMPTPVAAGGDRPRAGRTPKTSRKQTAPRRASPSRRQEAH